MKAPYRTLPRQVGFGLAIHSTSELPEGLRPTAHDTRVYDSGATSLILGKWHYYQSVGNIPATEAGLLKASRMISADLIKEGHGLSVDDVKEELRSYEWFAILKEKIKDSLPWFLNPTFLMVTVGLFGGAYLLNTYGSFIPRSRR